MLFRSDDPGRSMVEYAHGSTDEILKYLPKGLGGGDSTLDKLELVEILLGDDVKAHLDAEVQAHQPLHKIIKEHLEDNFES